MEQVVILGSTGSIGTNTLEVIRRHPDKYSIFALTAAKNCDKLLQQCIEFKPQYAILLDTNLAANLQNQLKSHQLNTQVLSSSNDLATIVTMPDVQIVMSAIVGSAGLLPTYNALKAGKKVLLANKESLIAAGKLMVTVLRDTPSAQLIPVDSEHSAIFQSLPHDFIIGQAYHRDSIAKIILTASGGPFRTYTREQISGMTAREAIKHPNWQMGAKISVDSSTLMNKGLEVIEACALFACDAATIEVVVHPQSIIHSMVEYVDGSIIAQLGTADMQTPIAYALSYPERIHAGSRKLDFMDIVQLTFEKPDYAKFPCLELAFAALKAGKAAAAVLNAANEVAVAAFLADRIKFYDINQIIEKSMVKFIDCDYNSIDEVIELDNAVRHYASTLL